MTICGLADIFIALLLSPLVGTNYKNMIFLVICQATTYHRFMHIEKGWCLASVPMHQLSLEPETMERLQSLVVQYLSRPNGISYREPLSRNPLHRCLFLIFQLKYPACFCIFRIDRAMYRFASLCVRCLFGF